MTKKRHSQARKSVLLAELRRQSATALAKGKGFGVAPSEVRLLFDLYQHVLGFLRNSRERPRRVSYQGVSFPIGSTNLGRLRVLDPDTGEELVVGAVGDLW